MISTHLWSEVSCPASLQMIRLVCSRRSSPSFFAQLSKEGSAPRAEASCEGEGLVDIRWRMRKEVRALDCEVHHSSASCVIVRIRSLRRERRAARTSISEVSCKEVMKSGRVEGGGREADWTHLIQWVRWGEFSSGLSTKSKKSKMSTRTL